MSQAEQLITDNLDVWTSAIKKRGSQGRGSSKKIELYGIKKLRELILELAVRGLLVPQDPNDEPASVLLEKITAEKIRLIKEGNIKKQKKLAPISEEETPFDLSGGWEWVRFQDVSEYIQRGKGPEYSDSGKVRVVSQKCVQLSGFDITPARCVADSSLDKYQPERFLQDNDLLWNSTGTGTVGRINVINNIPAQSLVADSHVTVIRTIAMNTGFLWSYISAPGIQNRIDPTHEQALVSGSTKQVELNTSAVINLLVPVPPEAEQSRIVAKVDELMALCDQLEQQTEDSLSAHQALVETLLNALLDAAQSRDDRSSKESAFDQAWQRIAEHFDILFTTEHSIDQLKQTILQLAVMGKLVPQDPNDEPASVLLEKIAAEKERLVKEGKIKKQKPLPEIGEDEKPFELPVGWEWCNLNQLISLMDAGWSPACPPEPSPNDETWGVLKTTAVQTLQYLAHENKILSESKDPRPQYEVKKGDLLITRAGPKNRVGISCLVEETRPKLMISDKIIRFHLVEVGIEERFIALCLNAGATALYLESCKSGMAESQMNISQDKLKAAPIPLSPINESIKIMNRVDELMSICDLLKARIAESQTTQLYLADAMAATALQ